MYFINYNTKLINTITYVLIYNNKKIIFFFSSNGKNNCCIVFFSRKMIAKKMQHSIVKFPFFSNLKNKTLIHNDLDKTGARTLVPCLVLVISLPALIIVDVVPLHETCKYMFPATGCSRW